MATPPLYIYGDTCTAVLNLARSRVDDLLQTPALSPTGGGAIQDVEVGGAALLRQLDDDAAIFLPTQVIFNTAWRKAQLFLTQHGWRGLIDTVTLVGLPANAAADVAELSYLSWNGNWDGTSFTTSPQLPATFVAPLKIRERLTGTAAFTDMTAGLYGLRNVPTRSALNRQWEWRGNALYFIGATEITDLQVRCVSLYQDFLEDDPDPWYAGIIPIPRFASALAWFIAYEVCLARWGEQESAGILVNAQTEAMQILSNQRRGDGIEPLAADLVSASAPAEAEL